MRIMDGETIKELRIRMGLTQKQLATRLGVDQVTVNRWENCKAIPSPMACQELERLAAVT